MNKLGIEMFKSEIEIGDEISVNTREHFYCGIVVAIEDDCFWIVEDNMKFHIYYAHVWAYSK